MQIPIVENPTKRKRRKLSPAQRAAGFGGKRTMAKRRTRKKTTKRRRRNPALATYVVNPRRRKYRRKATVRRRRRRNPGLGKIGAMLNLRMALSVAAGILTARMAPGLLQKVWTGAPTTGFGGHAVRMGSVILVGYGVKMVTRSNQFAGGVVAGGIGYILYDMANEYILPKIGLSGYGDDYATMSELEEVALGRYVTKGDPIAQYEGEGMGAYQPGYGEQVLAA